MPARFRDGGESLRSFGDEVLVRCPSCAACAVARPDPRDPGEAATLTCTSCGLARRTPEPIREPRTRRCPRCDRWIPASRWTQLGDGPGARHEASCARCGNVVRARVERWGTAAGAPVDPWFREPLFLQRRCRGELLWAWNVRHLDVLAALVGASLRERAPGRGSNRSLLSRLPRWMKAAASRADVLAAIEALRAALRPAPARRARRGRPPGAA